MTVTVKLYDDEQEKVLLNFLDDLKYEYHKDENACTLTDNHKQQILKREADFAAGLTTAKNWEDIKQSLQHVYR